ncbi:hypothetical protein [Herbaspirillum sp. YR522]|uniref:hypothetical protein n=1 Tax=Herbaspirillum sp. YR522 TaxID=1144342 RepID=UPI00026F8825|nr:hypothetical protein [Herbaspirillum sp. YR522]EJN08024.1 hypothetical protein PMI40_01511 [Herbaspirillum sp. YR522]
MNQSSSIPALSDTNASQAAQAINVLSPAARQRLSDLFTARAAMQPISVSYDQPQAPADPWAIFELRKNGNRYSLVPTVEGATLVPRADGLFIYVVRADDPGRIYVGVPYGRVAIDDARLAIQGHTSLTQRADVLYAGDFHLRQGRLEFWTNGSGHYRPAADRRQANLLPVVRTLLPEASFVDYWNQENSHRRTQLEQLRGYMNMMDPHAPPATPAPAGGTSNTSTGNTSNSNSTSGTGNSTSDSILDSTSGEGRLRLRIGNSEVALEHAMDLGAMLDERPLHGALRQPTAPAMLQNGLADRLSFDGDLLERQIVAQRITGIEDLLFELAGQRTGNAPIVVDGGSRSRPWIAQANAMLERVQTLSAMMLHQPRQNIVTCLMPGDAPIRHTGLGLHLFGIYNGLRGLRTAIVRGDTSGAIAAGSELAATGIGVAAEEALQSLGAVAQRGTAHSLNQFSRTAIGRLLGGPSRLGSNLARSAPLAGALITAPFDAYNAVDSFQLAAQASGAQAQDHYVDAGLATVSLVTTVGLGAAGYAGLASAGPIGLATGAVLVLVGRTYHSVRYVERLQGEIALTRGEVVATGLRNVIGMDPPRDVLDRLTISQAVSAYRQDTQQRLQSSLAHLGRLGVSQVVFGDAIISLRAPLQRTEREMRPSPAGEVMITRVIEEPQPPDIIGNAGDDFVDARAGLGALQNVVSIAEASDDKVLWMTGRGDDTLMGLRMRGNLFDVQAGKKTMHGGIEADRFELNAAPHQGSVLDGGLGDDTLVLSLTPSTAGTLEMALAGHAWRHDYRLIEDRAGDNYQAAGSQNWMTYPRDLPGLDLPLSPGWIDIDGKRSELISIENVITNAGATTRIVGNGQDNLFVLNGRDDSVDGGLGDDTYIVQGGGNIRVKAGAGANRYQLQRTIEKVEIDGARAGQHTLHLDFDLHELLFETRQQAVEISVAGHPDQRIVLADIYRTRDDGQREAVRPDGQVRLMTRDAMAVTPLFSRYTEQADGLIELLAKPWTNPALQGPGRFATAQEIRQLDQLVAASGGWQGDTGMASAGQVEPSGQRDALLGAPLAMAA